MKTAVKDDFKSLTFCINKKYICLIGKETSLINFKFYQKVFVLLISFSTILIFLESPRELENICEAYNSRNKCNVW